MAEKKKTQNVAISKKNYIIIAKFCKLNGYKIGHFFESSAIEKLSNKKSVEIPKFPEDRIR